MVGPPIDKHRVARLSTQLGVDVVIKLAPDQTCVCLREFLKFLQELVHSNLPIFIPGAPLEGEAVPSRVTVSTPTGSSPEVSSNQASDGDIPDTRLGTRHCPPALCFNLNLLIHFPR